MSDFEQGLANIMGSFMEVNLDCVEKQNQEIEQLQQENKQLKEVIEEVREYIKAHIEPEYRNGRDNEFYLELNQKELNELLQILDKGVKED